MNEYEMGKDARELEAAALAVLKADIDELVKQEVARITPGLVRAAIRRVALRLFVATAIIVASAVGLFAYGYYRIAENTTDIAATERLDREASRSAAFRICTRDTQGRAEFQFLVQQFELPDPFVKSILIGLQRRLPIVDCSPNLAGRSAVVIEAPEQQRAYISIYSRTGLAPETLDGRVTGNVLPMSETLSRPSK